MFLFLLFNITITFPCHATAVPDYMARLRGLRNVGIYGIEHHNKNPINDKLTKLHDRFKSCIQILVVIEISRCCSGFNTNEAINVDTMHSD